MDHNLRHVDSLHASLVNVPFLTAVAGVIPVEDIWLVAISRWNHQACRPEIGWSILLYNSCTNGPRSAQEHPKTPCYCPYRTTTYAKLGRFVIGRSPVQKSCTTTIEKSQTGQ
jgi:hypothetical protein